MKVQRVPVISRRICEHARRIVVEPQLAFDIFNDQARAALVGKDKMLCHGENCQYPGRLRQTILLVFLRPTFT